MPDEPIAILREEYPWGGRICELFHDRLGVRDATAGKEEATILPLDLFDPAPSRTAKRIPTPNGWAFLMLPMSVGAVYVGAAWIAVLSYPALVRLGWGLSLVHAEPGELPVASIVRIVLCVLVSLAIVVCMAAFFRSRKREYIAFKHSESKRGILDFERFKSNGVELDAFVKKMSERISAVPPREDKTLTTTFAVPYPIHRHPELALEYHPGFGGDISIGTADFWEHRRMTTSGVSCGMSGKGRKPEPEEIELWRKVESELPKLFEIGRNAIPPPPERPEEFHRESLKPGYVFLAADGTLDMGFESDFFYEIAMWPSVQLKDGVVIPVRWSH